MWSKIFDKINRNGLRYKAFWGVWIVFILGGIPNFLIFSNIKRDIVEQSSGIKYREQEEYIFPSNLETEKDNIVQYFKPTADDLTEIHIRLAYNNSSILASSAPICSIALKDSRGQVIESEIVSKNDVENWEYYVLEPPNLQKGKIYSITLQQLEGHRDEKTGKFSLSWVPFVYSKQEEIDNVPSENVKCEYNGIEQNFAWDIYYVYRHIDYQNVIILVIINLIIVTAVLLLNAVMSKKNQMVTLIYIFVVPIMDLILIEMITGNIHTIESAYLWINLLFLYVIFVLVLFFFKRIKIGIVLFQIVCPIIALVEYYVYGLRGRSFMLQDIRSLQTATTVMNAYSYDLELIPGIATLFFVALLAVATMLPNINWTKFSGIRKIAVLTLAYVSYLLLSDEDIMNRTSFMSMALWDIEVNYKEKGYIRTLLAEIQYLKQKEPESYSINKVREITEYYLSKYEELEEDYVIQPKNLFLIMNESWADLRYIADFQECDTITPYIDSLTENVIKGFLHMPVFGAGTANSEYEVLTGNSTQFLGSGNIAYQLFISQKEYGLASIFRSMGWQAIAMHPNLATNWNRNIVYPRMGFEQFISQENWSEENWNALRWCISDEASYRELIDLYENKGEESLFTFLVTMQNHGGYNWEEYEANVSLDYEEDYPLAEQYLSLIQETDRAFAELVNYFEQIQEPTMIVMFGDHLPNIEQEFYELLFETDWDSLDLLQKQKIYTTPYVIWTNYELPEIESVEMSSNYFGSFFLQLAGLEMTDYNKCLLAFMKEVPVIGTGAVMDADGKWYQMEDLPDYLQKVINDYQILQYNNVFGQNNRINGIFSIAE